MSRVLLLGTAAGLPVNSTCTSMLVEDDDTSLIPDLACDRDLTIKMHQTRKYPLDIRGILITHFDSDHTVGLFPLMRYFSSSPATAPQVNILRRRSLLKRQGA